MTLPAGLPLREATLDDLPAIARLRESVGWGVVPWALRAVIGQDDARCVLAVTPDGEVAGVGSGIVYGKLGFVGNMVVGERHRRRGVGSAILESVTGFLERAGCTTLELNATSDGRPLYERHGFRTVGTSLAAAIPRRAPVERHPAVTVRQASAADFELIAAYDLPRFGGDRSRVLRILLNEPDSAARIAERDAAVVGYGVVRLDSARIGPLVADEPAVAASLLVDAFARARDADALRVNLPPGNRRGAEWLRSLGVALETWDGRMARGADVARREETIYGMAVGALG